MPTCDAHREAFRRYLPHGTPMRLALKEEPPTTHYVWRTRRDESVRPTHRELDAHLIAWDDPPEVGHPGHEPNCRCVAIPYVQSTTEYATHEITTDLTRMVRRWDDADFVGHFYTGGGRTVTLREIGHLGEVAKRFAYEDGAEGAFRCLSDQIATKAREIVEGPFEYSFDQSYDFEAGPTHEGLLGVRRPATALRQLYDLRVHRPGGRHAARVVGVSGRRGGPARAGEGGAPSDRRAGDRGVRRLGER